MRILYTAGKPLATRLCSLTLYVPDCGYSEHSGYIIVEEVGVVIPGNIGPVDEVPLDGHLEIFEQFFNWCFWYDCVSVAIEDVDRFRGDVRDVVQRRNRLTIS